MPTAPYGCRSCPDMSGDLILIETRFEKGLCFVELECRHCHGLWTAEVSMPVTETNLGLPVKPEADVRQWRLVNLKPLGLVERTTHA